ncbi:MAG: ATP-binding protein [Kribbellaceae bacterium]|nr:ATP-binding protein [Kribbellaceae bacterium]
MTLIRRRPVGSGAAAADFALACVLLVVAPYVVPAAARFGTWGAFEPGYALSVIITASGVRSLVLWAAGLVGVVLCYVVYLGNVAAGMVTTAMGNELTFVVYAVVARMLFNYIRRIAHDADVSRARVAELARQDEERRARVVMHNGVALMQLLAHSGPAVSQSGLADLAEAELQRMRAYLRGTASPDPMSGDDSEADAQVRLAAMVTRVCERFADLRVEPLLDLGTAVRIPADEAAAVERAVESLLLNVRAYAKAENVVIHLDQHGAGGWSLTVSDDGVGFDPSVVVPGVGLREVVVGELRRRGLGVMITSAPGDGTTVTIDREAR